MCKPKPEMLLLVNPSHTFIFWNLSYRARVIEKGRCERFEQFADLIEAMPQKPHVIVGTEMRPQETEEAARHYGWETTFSVQLVPSDPTTVDLNPAVTGAERILAERRRQLDKEGWTAAHDDQWDDGELLDGANSYLTFVAYGPRHMWKVPRSWPWGTEWWKPAESDIRNLEKAGALIAAEIDRLLRLGERDPQRADGK